MPPAYIQRSPAGDPGRRFILLGLGNKSRDAGVGMRKRLQDRIAAILDG
jgi:hypothetical protein